MKYFCGKHYLYCAFHALEMAAKSNCSEILDWWDSEVSEVLPEKKNEVAKRVTKVSSQLCWEWSMQLILFEDFSCAKVLNNCFCFILTAVISLFISLKRRYLSSFKSDCAM